MQGEPQGEGIVREFARAESERLASTMRALTTSGTADWSVESNDPLITLTRCARQSIDATSCFVDLPFWRTTHADQYLHAQHEAIRQRGVKVRRLFIVERPEDLDAGLDGILEQQRNAGIQARVVVLSQLLFHVRMGGTADVVIFDGELCFELITDVQGSDTTVRLDGRARHVTQRRAWFDELWDAGMEGPPDLRGR
ncbi:DUF6879 family protein [Streptomyces sp. R28]|uniref:DUF6879 family protein n=1 Tax=Streptomyces sp. R28 TaxID=3238628 RepID=A0AB39PX72_9ACTN